MGDIQFSEVKNSLDKSLDCWIHWNYLYRLFITNYPYRMICRVQKVKNLINHRLILVAWVIKWKKTFVKQRNKVKILKITNQSKKGQFVFLAELGFCDNLKYFFKCELVVSNYLYKIFGHNLLVIVLDWTCY